MWYISDAGSVGMGVLATAVRCTDPADKQPDGPEVASDLNLPGKAGWQIYKSEPHYFEARGRFKSVTAGGVSRMIEVNTDILVSPRNGRAPVLIS